jgi:heme exporter protein D
MELNDWLTLTVAFVAVVVPASYAFRHQRQQLRSIFDKLDREQRFSTQQTVDAVEREHFARLWEVRKDAYARLAAWLMDLRERIRVFETGGPWVPQERLDFPTLGQLVVYGAMDVFSRAEMLRGEYEQVMANVEALADRLPPGYQREELIRISADAYTLLMVVREEALLLPNWGEPIPLRKDAIRRRTNGDVLARDASAGG